MTTASRLGKCMICRSSLWVGTGDPEEGYCLGSRTHMIPPDAGDIAEAHRDYPGTNRGAWGERFEYEGDKYDPCIEGEEDWA